MTSDDKNIERYLNVIVRLLSRPPFKIGEIREIVTSRKQEPDKYIEGYNALDGTKTLSEIASIIGVTKSTLSPILRDWERKGIVFELENNKGVCYKHIRPIVDG